MFKRRTLRSYSIWLLAVILLSVAGYIVSVRVQGNFYPITPGEAYRSAQPDSDNLAHYVKKYKIRSVLNLRGRHPDESWYVEEMAASAKLGLQHYDVALSASQEPTDAEAGQLLEIFKTAPRPLLIHCQAGADRSGLAAAMWKVVVDKDPKSVASKQLSLRYGHVPFGETQAMDRFFERWNPGRATGKK